MAVEIEVAVERKGSAIPCTEDEHRELIVLSLLAAVAGAVIGFIDGAFRWGCSAPTNGRSS